MPRTPFLLPGVGAQGGDVRALAPAFAPRPRRRPRDRLALDRQRLRAARRQPGRRGARGGRAPARDRVGWGSPDAGAGVSSGAMARRSPARLLAPLALVGFVVALLVVINGASRATAPRARAARSPPRRRRPRRRASRRPARRAGATSSRPATRRRGSRRRPACRCRRSSRSTPTSTTRRSRSATRSSCANDAGARPRGRARRGAGARARRERLRRHAAARRLGAERARRRGVDRRRRLRQGPDRRRAIASTTKLMTALLTLERAPALGRLPRGPLPRAARPSRRSGCGRASA